MGSSLGLASRTIVLLVIGIIVLAILVYLVASSYFKSNPFFKSAKCKGIMYNQCVVCASGNKGDNCVEVDGRYLCNECDIRYVHEKYEPRIDSIVAECVDELTKIGITIRNDPEGNFCTEECNKIGVGYAPHSDGDCQWQ